MALYNVYYHNKTCTDFNNVINVLNKWIKIFLCIFGLFNSYTFINASFQIKESSTQTRCGETCNFGTCINGVCICPIGWTGAHCESCFGRIKISALNGTITDGPNNYNPSLKCIWFIDNDFKEGALLLKLEDFFTECCWDHVYIYDGDGVYNTLIASFSGSLSGVEIVAKSGKAIVYFTSDLAYNLPGFTINFKFNHCPFDCNKNGYCKKDGTCKCNKNFKGDFCEQQICLNEMDGLHGPCKYESRCKNGRCECRKNMHGDYCQESISNYVWDKIYAYNYSKFKARASHKAVLFDKKILILGGFFFNEQKFMDELIFYNITKMEFYVKNSLNKSPKMRSDHSIIYYNQKIYIFGGIIRDNVITNEFWSLDLLTYKWSLLNNHNNSFNAIPLAVAGHTAHVIDNEMYVIFGYNPYEAYIYCVQIYSFETKKWRKIDADINVVGKFGHSSVLYQELNKNPIIFIYGGYNAFLNGHSYTISDELFLFDVTENIWTSLGKTGVPLFRHTSVILDGIMYIVGGNSHNESSKLKHSDCYSNQFLAFDIKCREWQKLKSDSLLLRRYGHAAVSDKKNMYIIGGFNGTLLKDIIKFTPPNNQTQKNCFLKKNQSNFCVALKDCNDCLQKGCNWCESNQTCSELNTVCLNKYKKICSNEGKLRNKISKPKRSCSFATNCFACQKLKHCLWFAIKSINSRHVCVSFADEAALSKQLDRMQAEGILTQALSISDQNVDNLLNFQISSNLNNSRAFQHFTSSDKTTSPLSSTINNNNSMQFNKTCLIPCFLYTDCQSCIQFQCMWCASSNKCIPMDTYMLNFPYGQCQSWITSSNTNQACQIGSYDCTLQKTCSECQTIGPHCGWCDDGSGTGLGKCIAGTNTGPLETKKCLSNQWYFSQEPACQCNGHSTCLKNLTLTKQKCLKCANKTRGDHCEKCKNGYFGDPRNGGKCEKCQCNEQATSCDQETGDCHCFTKGVTGAHCDKCDQKYDSDPAHGKICIYKLLIGFIFTFKLDSDDVKDKYVNQINFYSIPTKRDTDVQFSIICEGDSKAKVYINLTTVVVDGKPLQSKQLMAGHLCTASGIKQTYSATDPGFAFGTDANTTFYICVSNFVTPLKIVISFAQSPPINWVLFFVIFAACFIVLLVVSGLLWMIKLRIEWYRNIRRIHEEIEEMASRPFASVQLYINSWINVSDNLFSNVINLWPTPVSVEPCGNYSYGIYTILIRLPTGGKLYTPCGTSGLAVGSSLCHLTNAQLALLQPPNSLIQQNRPNNRKSTFRRFIPFIKSSNT